MTTYEGYAYSYPHKTAYRALPEPVDMAALWASERREALFLYLHVPFCEMRCGFCNLFTTVNGDRDLHTSYVAALRRQASQVLDAIGGARFARAAIGGGTPTILDSGLLDQLLAMLAGVPASVETSPITATSGKIALLRSHGVQRVSIGVQSFVEEEARAAGRSQSTAVVRAALERLAHAGFPVLNIDLMYGLPGQTVATWLGSIREALSFAPAELFLYPLYVRPLTGLGRAGAITNDSTLRECYEAGRAFLLGEGFEQISMRLFRRAGSEPRSSLEYCCQSDGMVGLGCGARSYTRSLHYSFEYAVSAGAVRTLVDGYIGSADGEFRAARYGMALSGDEQRRRFVIQSVLQSGGLDLSAYCTRFGTDATSDFAAEFQSLANAGHTTNGGGSIRLTAEGMAASDAIGPRFYSSAVRERMRSFSLR